MGILSFSTGQELFVAYLREAGYGERTIERAVAMISVFGLYLARHGPADLRAVDRASMLAYVAYVHEERRTRMGKPLSSSYRIALIRTARQFFRVLLERRVLLVSPMRGLEYSPSQVGRELVGLSEDEAARFLDSIDPDTRLGLRDRALFELIYSSGLRASEAGKLLVSDFDPETTLLRVRQGKCSKDRTVPVTEPSRRFLMIYRGDRSPDVRLFRSTTGGAMSPSAINKRFKLRLSESGIERRGLSVHALRHACATHLVGRGADIRYVQELLGHESVQTTVRYTREQVENVRRMYLKFHPREHDLKRLVDAPYRAALERLQDRLQAAQNNRLARRR